jgi:hypothetical protein
VEEISQALEEQKQALVEEERVITTETEPSDPIDDIESSMV